MDLIEKLSTLLRKILMICLRAGYMLKKKGFMAGCQQFETDIHLNFKLVKIS